MSLEQRFDAAFVASLALSEKQVQQSYRPIIGVHKWFARRPGSVFRSLLLTEFLPDEALATSYWRSHVLSGVVADPFMGGGTPVIEANRLGLSIIAADTNPMAWWITRQSLTSLDLKQFSSEAARISHEVELDVGDLYETRCFHCGNVARVKYFLWVKTQRCPLCGTCNDLFPGYLLAEAVRHPAYVVACAGCGELNEFQRLPVADSPGTCSSCGRPVVVEGPARHQKMSCRTCGAEIGYPRPNSDCPPTHRMWAIEYHCESCKPGHVGRFFKKPDHDDVGRYERARQRLAMTSGLSIPSDEIPPGDETDRLRRWGYRHYREMFSDRQLLGLGTLLRNIETVSNPEVRHALLTVFSDFLRYQNMVCRYDTYALKCQDIFSVHGFPVGLVQCENNLLGIPHVGAGGFRHFVEKYLRAKRYCVEPFETRREAKGSKKRVRTEGEKISAELVASDSDLIGRKAFLFWGSADELSVGPESLDGVFTDPPYYDNVQYAELMDFCYVWLRSALASEFNEFLGSTTRTPAELTGNLTLGRGLSHFTLGLSTVFSKFARALKPGRPFVFTYHHNSSAAYVPIIVAILDAGMDCHATFPTVGEMSASLHIQGTGSSILDSVFVCRVCPARPTSHDITTSLKSDVNSMISAGVHVTAGDIGCLANGHAARAAVNQLRQTWSHAANLEQKIRLAKEVLERTVQTEGVQSLVPMLLQIISQAKR